jgi:hypothetical protein
MTCNINLRTRRYAPSAPEIGADGRIPAGVTVLAEKDARAGQPLAHVVLALQLPSIGRGRQRRH